MSAEVAGKKGVIAEESLAFLLGVMPALDISDGQFTELAPSDVGARMEALADKAEALAETYTSPSDQRLAIFSATLLRLASPNRQTVDLRHALYDEGYSVETWQVPIVTHTTAAWLCEQFVEPIDTTPMAKVIPLRATAARPHPEPNKELVPPEPMLSVEEIEIGSEPEPENPEIEDIIAEEPPLDSDEELQALLKKLEAQSFNDADLDIYRQYLREVSKRPLLNAEQEVDLAKSIEAGLFAKHVLAKAEAEGATLSAQYRRNLSQLEREGARSKNTLLESNLRLVISIARRYYGLELVDLIQEGNIGLIRAVEKFDYQKGYKFSTYATWWIRQAITRAIADRGHAIRVPVHAVEEYRRYTREKRDLTARLKREPSIAEVAAEMGMDKERLTDLVQARERVRSLDSKAPGYEDGATLGELLQDDAWILEQHDVIGDDPIIDYARKAIPNVLTPIEYDVIQARFLPDERTGLEMLGERYGVSRETIRLWQLRAIAKLLHPSVPLGTDEGIKMLGGKPEQWRYDAQCYGTDTALFFSQKKRGANHPTSRLCGSCVVRASCLQFADDHDINHGVWGGVGAYKRATQRATKPES